MVTMFDDLYCERCGAPLSMEDVEEKIKICEGCRDDGME